MRRGVVLVPEGRHVIAPLSVADNVLLGRSCHGWRRPSAEAQQCTSRLYAVAQGLVRFSGGWADFASDGDLLASYL